MSKKLFSAFLFVVFSSVLAYAGGVTNIKEVINNSSKVVKLTTYEAKHGFEGAAKKTTGVITYGNIWNGDMWIPWADNEEQFKGHFMSIEIIELRRTRGTDIYHTYIVYQSGDYVRVSFYGMVEQRGFGILTSGSFDPDARRVSGESKSGGERRVVFSTKKTATSGSNLKSMNGKGEIK